MHKTLLLSTVFLVFLVACQQRPCPTTKHNGLYNALTCDYQSETFKLEQNLSHHKSKTLELKKERNTVANETYTQENQLNKQKEQIQDKELLLTDIKRKVDNMDAQVPTKEILENLNSQIKNMRKALKKGSH